MTDTHDELLDDVALYALGTLAAADAQRVRDHLQTCDTCRAEYEALVPVVAALGTSQEASADASSGSVVASPLIKARIMREVRKKKHVSSNGHRRHLVWPAYAVAAACFALATASVLYNIALNDRLHQAEIRLAHQSVVNERDDSMLSDLANVKAQRVSVPGGEVVRSNGHLYLAMHDMPAAPDGKVYQAWTLPKGAKKMVPSATFVPDNRGVALVPVSNDAVNTVAVAVSIEPPGGSKQPTSAPVFVAHLE